MITLVAQGQSLPGHRSSVPHAEAGHHDVYRRLRLAPLVAVSVAAIIAAFGDPTGDLPSSIVGVLVALIGLGLVMFGKVRRAASLFLLVFFASFVDYQMILTARSSLFSLPINIIDIAVVLVLLTTLLKPKARVRELTHGSPRNASLAIAALVVGLTPAFLVGIIQNGLYDAFRDFRPVILVAASFYVARRLAVQPATKQLLVHTIFLGGVYGMVVTVLIRARLLPTLADYTSLRSQGSGTATMDFAFILAIAFAVCGESLFRRKWLTWSVCALAVVASVFSFSLTSYSTVGLVPALCLWLAPTRTRRKMALGLLAFGLVAGVLVLVLNSSFLEEGRLGRIVAQVVNQYGDLSSSIHVESRLLTWKNALSLLPGWRLLTGIGMGTRIFFDTGISEVGTVIVGEPTYGRYLIGAGFVGLLPLAWLQTRFIKGPWKLMHSNSVPYMKAVRLTLVVYGIIIIVNGFLHNTFMSPQVSVLYGILTAIGSSVDVLDGRGLSATRAET